MAIGFSPAQWRRIEADYTAWWHGELDRALICLVIDEPNSGDRLSRFMTNWSEDMSDDAIVDAVAREVSRCRFHGDALPYRIVNFGPGVAAAFAGSGLRKAEDTVWFEPMPHTDLSDIRIAHDPDNRWWKRVLRVTRVLAERIGDRVQISFTDLGGNLDILASLRGTDQLLIDLIEQPEEVERCVREVTAMWIDAYDRLHQVIAPNSPGTIAWAPTWAAGMTYMLQCDISYMFSPEMFRRFVAPDLKACCDHLAYAFYHMDGVGQVPHLDQLLAIENLHGIQWIPGAGKPMADGWPDLLGRIREAGKLVQVGVSPEGALEIIRRHGGKGFLLVIVHEGMTDAQARRFIAEAAAASRA